MYMTMSFSSLRPKVFWRGVWSFEELKCPKIWGHKLPEGEGAVGIGLA
jgi:hypothetical protein